MLNRLLYLFVLLITVAACGGGSSGGGSVAPPPPNGGGENASPTVSIGNDLNVNEKEDVTLTATASDSDGSISSYEWELIQGPSITFDSTNQASISFTAPETREDILVELRVTVTDNDGATASDNINLTVKPVNEISFTLKGIVTTGEPIDGVKIVGATVNFQTSAGNITTQTDTEGEFELEVGFDESFEEEIPEISATGAGNQSHIMLFAVPKSLQVWNSLAGTDGVLDTSDTLDVNISNYSTALYGQIIEKLGQIPQNMDDVTQGQKLLLGEELISAANSIAVISQYTGTDQEYILSPSESTFTFAMNKQLRTEYFARNNQKDEYLAIISNQLSNTFIYEQNDVAFSAGEQFFQIDHIPDFTTPLRLIFNTDGTGLYHSREASFDFAFNANNNQTALQFDPVALGTLTVALADGTSAQRAVTLLNVSMNLLDETESNKLFAFDVEYAYVDENGGSEIVTDRHIYHLLKATSIIPFVESDIDPSTLMFRLQSPAFMSESSTVTSVGTLTSSTDIFIDKVSVSTTGAQSEVLGFNQGSYDIQGQENFLRLSYGLDTIDIYQLSGNLFYTETYNSGDLMGTATGSASISTTPITWNDVSIPGTYTLDWDSTDMQRFWIELNADGTARTVSGSDFDGDRTLDTATIYDGKWYIEGDILKVDRFRSTSGPCLEGEIGCGLYNIRELDLNQVINNRFFTGNDHKFYYSFIYPDVSDVEGVEIFRSHYPNSWIKSDSAIFGYNKSGLTSMLDHQLPIKISKESIDIR